MAGSPVTLPADEPKTDRDWLIMISKDVKALTAKIDGEGGICARQKDQDMEVRELKKELFYHRLLLVILIFLIAGRYLFGPTSFPLVP